MAETDRLGRAAVELLALGVLGALVAALLPWEATGDVILQRPLLTGVELGWGVVVAAVAAAPLVVAARQDWRVPVLPSFAAGVGLLATRFVLAVVADGGVGATVPETFGVGPVGIATEGVAVPFLVDLSGVALVGAGALGAVAHSGRWQPRPKPGRSVAGHALTRRRVVGLATGGTALVLGSVGAAWLLPNGGPGPLDVHATVTVGFPVLLAVFAAARAWSWPVALLAVPTGAWFAGYVAWLHVTAVWTTPVLTAYPFAGALTLLGGLALAAAGLLELVGEESEPPRDSATTAETTDGGVSANATNTDT